jgi:CHAT domain-containing protein
MNNPRIQALRACITDPNRIQVERNRHDPKARRLAEINRIAQQALETKPSHEIKTLQVRL